MVQEEGFQVRERGEIGQGTVERVEAEAQDSELVEASQCVLGEHAG